MSKSIISDIPNREVFFHLLEHNPGLIVLNSEPKDTDFNSTFDAINIIFNANSAVGQKLSYIIILNN